MVNHIGQHVAHMVALGKLVALWVVNPVIDGLVIGRPRVHIHTRHHADAFDYSVCIAAVLPPHQLDLVEKILVENRVVEHHATRRDRRHQVADVTHIRGGGVLSSRKIRLIASWRVASVWSAKCGRVWLSGLASKY